MKLIHAGWLSAVVLAAAASADAAQRGLALEVTHGAVDDGDSSVVAFAVGGASQPTCTGTLVAPTLVLTAAHCLERGTPSAVSTDKETLAVRAAVTHPAFDPVGYANDLAVLVLERPVWLEPVKFADVTSIDEGKPLRVVGYGVPTPSDFVTGQKRSGTTSLAKVDGETIRLSAEPSQPCFGDSGGPVFLAGADGTEALVGVTSHGELGCTAGAFAVRIAAYDAFLRPHLDASYREVETQSGCTVGANPRVPTGAWVTVPGLVAIALVRRARRRRPERLPTGDSLEALSRGR